MPEAPTEEEQARAELAKIARSIGRLYRRVKAVQDRLPETPEDHPLAPNTLWAVCEEVSNYCLKPAEERLSFMTEMSDQELLLRKRDWEVCVSLVIVAASRLPPEYVFAALSRLIHMPPIDFFRGVIAVRRESEERFIDGLLRESGGEGLKS